jgi:hypothetical protein
LSEGHPTKKGALLKQIWAEVWVVSNMALVALAGWLKYSRGRSIAAALIVGITVTSLVMWGFALDHRWIKFRE